MEGPEGFEHRTQTLLTPTDTLDTDRINQKSPCKYFEVHPSTDLNDKQLLKMSSLIFFSVTSVSALQR